MKLYHFTQHVNLENIKQKGLFLGVLPLIKNGIYNQIPGHQWLTINPNFEQPWNAQQIIEIDKCEVRLLIVIPKSNAYRLIKWTDYKTNEKFKETYELTTYAGDFENWWVFKGRIKPNWIRKVEVKPKKIMEKNETETPIKKESING